MKNERTPNRYDHLDTVRAFTILYVVMGHAIGYVPISKSLWDAIMYVIHPTAVPIFFLCDGFLFSLKANKGGALNYKEHITSSATRLLAPWILFSALYVAARGVFEYFGVLSEHLVIGQSPWQVIAAAYASKTAPQMYFLPALFLLRVLGFATWRILKLPVVWVVAAFLAYAVGYRLVEDVVERMAIEGSDPIVHALWGMQFFLAGAVLSRLHDVLRKYAWPLCAVLISTTVALYFVGVDSIALKGLNQYANILGTYFFFVALPWGRSVLMFVGARSMGIYLLHAPILIKVVSLACIALFSNVVVALVFTHITTFFVSLGAAIVVERTGLRFLFGTFGKKKPATP